MRYKKINAHYNGTFLNPVILIAITRSFVTNKTGSAKKVVLFHKGRGSWEGILGDAKNNAALDVIHSGPSAGNQIFTLCTMMITQNLSREKQTRAAPSAQQAIPKRAIVWPFKDWQPFYIVSFKEPTSLHGSESNSPLQW